MKTGEMLKLTQRLNQIKGASQALKDKRFNSMLDDIVLAYDAQNVYARRVYVAILEEMEV